MTNQRGKIAKIALAAAVVIAAMTGAAAAGIAAHAATTTTTRVRVTEVEYKIKLRTHSFKPGRVTFVVTNRGTLAHEFAIRGPGVRKRIPGKLMPMSTHTLTVRLRKGKYTLKCPIHLALG